MLILLALTALLFLLGNRKPDRNTHDKDFLPDKVTCEIANFTLEIHSTGDVFLRDRVTPHVVNLVEHNASLGRGVDTIRLTPGKKHTIVLETLIHDVCVLDDNLNHKFDKDDNIVIKTKEPLPRTNYMVIKDNIDQFYIYKVENENEGQ